MCVCVCMREHTSSESSVGIGSAVGGGTVVNIKNLF